MASSAADVQTGTRCGHGGVPRAAHAMDASLDRL